MGGDALINTVLQSVGFTLIIYSLYKFRIDFECFVEIHDGRIVFGIGLVDQAEVVKGPNIFGIDLKRPVCGCDGIAVITDRIKRKR